MEVVELKGKLQAAKQEEKRKTAKAVEEFLASNKCKVQMTEMIQIIHARVQRPLSSSREALPKGQSGQP